MKNLLHTHELKDFTNSVFEQASVMNLLVLNAKQNSKAIKILVFGFIFNFLLTYYLQRSFHNAEGSHLATDTFST